MILIVGFLAFLFCVMTLTYFGLSLKVGENPLLILVGVILLLEIVWEIIKFLKFFCFYMTL